MAKKSDEAVKCYFCGELITRANDLVIKKVPMATKKGGVRNFKRQLHLDCVHKYNEGLEDYELRTVENNEWDLVFQYFRNQILGVGKATISKEDKESHMAKRLLGLRLGQFYPSGNNTRILPRGYSFNTILITMKVVNPKIQAYLKTANFTDFKHRVNACMRFIVAEIPDVAKRLADQQKANKKLFEEPKKEPSFDYLEALKKQKQKEAEEKQKQEEESNGVMDDIASLLGGSL
ncbi:hypothetical protein [Peribacillus asahii]|uniref:hypothetical protein n=1 Tax=Peribacillus asahii TaxID=228899 RepID=UPI0037FFDD2B